MTLLDRFRTPVTTTLEVAAFLKHRSIIGRFPVLVDDFALRPIPLAVPTTLCTCNPSIMAKEDGWLVVLRTHDFYTVRDGRLLKNDVARMVNTIWLVKCSDDFQVKTPTVAALPDRIVDADTRRRFLRNGVSDCRVFPFRGDDFLLGYGSTMADRRDTMVLCRLRRNEIDHVDVIASPLGLRVEKNWMPIVSDREISAVYSVNPFRLVTIDGGRAHLAEKRPADPGAPEFRGSSQVVRHGEGRLCVVHRVIEIRWRRIYLHRFILFQPDWTVAAMSREFFIEEKGVEFCAGLAAKGDRYVMTYGVKDIHARAVELPRSVVERLLAGGWDDGARGAR